MPTDRKTFARRLTEAYRQGAASTLCDGLKPAHARGAFAVQRVNTQKWLSNGRQITGRKIGLASEGMQEQIGVDRPDYRFVFDDMLTADAGELMVALKPGDYVRATIDGLAAVNFTFRD